MFVTSNRAGRAPMGDATNRATTAAIAVGAAAALSLSYLAHGWYRSRRSPRVLVLVTCCTSLRRLRAPSPDAAELPPREIA